VLGLNVADDGLDSRATLHLATDGSGDAAHLPRDPDPEPVRVVVAAVPFVDVDAAGLHAGELFHVGTECVPVAEIAMHCLGMEHEMPALRLRHGGGGDTELAAELVRRAGFTLADALDLRSMKHIDLWTALMLFLGAHPQRQIEQRAEAGFQHRIAINLAADVADDPAEPRTQEHELPLGAFELVSAWV
jgi:hypothetical protein